MEAIILAGGFGKRLKSVLKHLPKPLAPIGSEPFLNYLFNFLLSKKFKKVILSTYYKHDLIKSKYGHNYRGLKIIYSKDQHERGTGGAIRDALKKTDLENIFIINGDTFFDVDFKLIMNSHLNKGYDATLSLKEMLNFDRYGLVKINSDGLVVSLNDKTFCEKGLIDAGVYLIKTNIFHGYSDLKKYSFNTFLSNVLLSKKIGSIKFKTTFIDIGVPQDYDKAQTIFKGYKW